MTQGVPTPEDQRAEFEAKYLTIRNASAAARAVGLEERTGRQLAKELEADPVFAEALRIHRASLRNRATDAVLSLIDLGVERAHKFEPVETEHGLSDIGANYSNAVASLARTAEKLERLDAERRGDVQGSTTEVHIHLAADDDDGSPKA